MNCYPCKKTALGKNAVLKQEEYDLIRAPYVIVAKYHKKPKSDGFTVHIYAESLSEMFYKIKVLPSKNSVGRMREGFTLTTGTIEAELVHQIAKAINKDLLALHQWGTKIRHIKKG